MLPRPVNAGVAPAAGPSTALDLLLQARVFRDLPLRGIGYPSRTQGENIMVLSMLESIDRSATLKSAAIGLYNSAGQLVAQWAAPDAGRGSEGAGRWSERAAGHVSAARRRD